MLTEEVVHFQLRHTLLMVVRTSDGRSSGTVPEGLTGSQYDDAANTGELSRQIDWRARRRF
jgi:hypothetical protein